MKKLFTFFFALTASVGTMFATVHSGSCGNNLTWSLNTNDRVLVISGSGAMWSNASDSWYSYRSYINSVSLPEGLTTISDYAFKNCTFSFSHAHKKREVRLFFTLLQGFAIPHTVEKQPKSTPDMYNPPAR